MHILKSYSFGNFLLNSLVFFNDLNSLVFSSGFASLGAAQMSLPSGSDAPKDMCCVILCVCNQHCEHRFHCGTCHSHFLSWSKCPLVRTFASICDIIVRCKKNHVPAKRLGLKLSTAIVFTNNLLQHLGQAKSPARCH